MANERLDLEKVSSRNMKMELRNRSKHLRHNNEPLYDPYDEPRMEESTESSFNLRELWLMIRRRKWLVLTIIMIVTTIVAIQMYRADSYYQAESTIEIAKESASFGNQGMAMTQDSDFDPFYQVNIKTKMLMLTSRTLLEDVVINLKFDKNDKFMDSSKKGWFGAAIVEKKYSDESLPTTVPAELEDDIIRSPAESARLAPYVKLIENSLNVQQVRDTRAISLSFVHTNPLIAAQVANEITKIFKQRNFTNRIGGLEQTEEWLKRSQRQVKAELEKAQADLEQYTRKHNIVSLDGGATLSSARLAQIQLKLTEAEEKRIKAEALYAEVQKGNVAKLAAEFDPNSKLVALQKDLGDLRVKEQQLSVRYGPENPLVQEVIKKITEVESQYKTGTKALEDKFKSDYDRALKEVRSIEVEKNKIKGEAVDGNQSGIKLDTLRQEVADKEKLYRDLGDKSQQAQLKVKEQFSNIRVLEPAQVPNVPAGPRRLLSILIAFFLSTAAAVGLAFFLEYLDNTIKTAEDVERYTNMPALGVIPAIASSTSLRKLPNNKTDSDETNAAGLALAGASIATQLMTLDNQSTVAEAYRALRTSVLLSSAGHPPKTILVTSGRPGEGKTTTAVNTAISLAQLGASVLIIDCDLRRPKVHKVFGITHVHGLSTYLSREADIHELIHPLAIPNLSLLPCGPTPPNPAELISSEKMRDMLIMLGEHYDHIIIDSPPLINVTDPVILSTMVDGVIMVVHAGKSTRDVVRRASQELTGVGAKVFGVVLNNVNLQREGYDEYYYQRYYSSYSSDNNKNDHS